MIAVSKSPLRVPLGGGGTDLPQFYEKEDGFWLSGTIDKFIYVVVKPRFEKTIRVAYSALEYVEHPNQLEHPIVRAILNKFGIKDHIEIASFADLPSRLGLGSSGAFTVGLLYSMDLSRNTYQNKNELAEDAFKIEHDVLERPVGRQDHYSAVYGSVKAYSVNKTGFVDYYTLREDIINELANWLSLFFIQRRTVSTSSALKKNTFENLIQIKKIGESSFNALRRFEFREFGKLVNEHWEIKKILSSENKNYDHYIQKAKKQGAISGKLIGAGGGGCLLFVSEPRKKQLLVKKLTKEGLVEIPFTFCNCGSKVERF